MKKKNLIPGILLFLIFSTTNAFAKNNEQVWVAKKYLGAPQCAQLKSMSSAKERDNKTTDLNKFKAAGVKIFDVFVQNKPVCSACGCPGYSMHVFLKIKRAKLPIVKRKAYLLTTTPELTIYKKVKESINVVGKQPQNIFEKYRTNNSNLITCLEYPNISILLHSSKNGNDIDVYNRKKGAHCDENNDKIIDRIKNNNLSFYGALSHHIFLLNRNFIAKNGFQNWQLFIRATREKKIVKKIVFNEIALNENSILEYSRPLYHCDKLTLPKLNWHKRLSQCKENFNQLSDKYRSINISDCGNSYNQDVTFTAIKTFDLMEYKENIVNISCR